MKLNAHKEDFTITDGGGSRWTACGTDGCIARVNFPAAALVSLINTEDETFDKILALAGESLDELFESRHYLKPIAGFSRRSYGCVAETRSDSTHRALPGRMFATREL